jgi:hypothetical protein
MPSTALTEQETCVVPAWKRLPLAGTHTTASLTTVPS